MDPAVILFERHLRERVCGFVKFSDYMFEGELVESWKEIFNYFLLGEEINNLKSSFVIDPFNNDSRVPNQ